MRAPIRSAGLAVHPELFDALEALAKDAQAPAGAIWDALAALLDELRAPHAALLAARRALAKELASSRNPANAPGFDPAAHLAFLQKLEYLLPEGPDFAIRTERVDPEIALIPGPQLVVPATIARFVVNAANARWGSLYDALYGADTIPETDGAQRGAGYNPVRGARVVAFAAAFLDQAAPLDQAKHADALRYVLDADGARKSLLVELNDGRRVGLARPEQFLGYVQASNEAPSALLLQNHGLRVEIQIDRQHPIGAQHPAGVKDVLLEAAVTTILDGEDSVAVVDGEDKALLYRNLHQLFRGDLEARFEKNGKTIRRALHPDRAYATPEGGELLLPGRSLLLVRSVGLAMSTDAVLDAQGRETPETFLDILACGLLARLDSLGKGRFRNSKTGAFYIVMPKLHGPKEVAFACELFSRVEQALDLPRLSLKIGVMDEERRTTLNLKECVRAAAERIIFINTGFLDRTGDEISSSMEAGPMLRKNDMRSAPWMLAYEDWNVDVALAAGFSGRAQVGKGMWAKPDKMREMLDGKQAHPLAGANCAWVPSPTAATLHALHYHAVDVFERQRALLAGGPRAARETLLRLPLLTERPSPEAIAEELETNAQSILGYVSRWVEQGVGCSKVPDLNDVGLMEDRATLRISSQHMANWIRHGICSKEQVLETLQRMALVVDRQNAADPGYRPMAPDFASSLAFQAASELVFEGAKQLNGYTEEILHRWRRQAKAR